MISARKLAKSFLYHARGTRIRALAAPREIPWLRRRLHLPSNDIFDPLEPVSSADVKVILLDPAGRFQRALPLLPDGHPDAQAFYAARTEETTAPGFVAEFSRGIAWGHPTGGVFTADARFAPAFTHDPCGAAFHTVWTRLSLPPPRRVRGRVLYLVTPEATDNFHHWMIDLLPRLGLVERAGYEIAAFDHVIVNHTARRYQRETLRRLGVAPEKIIRADDSLWVQADSLVVPSLKPDNQTLPASDAAFLRRKFLPVRAMASQRRLYLSRGDASFRRLRHESDFFPLLRAHGFEIVSPATLDVAGQAQLFAEAEIIVGPAGAAFANLVFASPGTQVVEIAPPGWLAAYHWMISARLSLDHSILLGEGPVMRGVPDVSARERDIVLKPEKLAALLASVTAVTSPRNSRAHVS